MSQLRAPSLCRHACSLLLQFPLDRIMNKDVPVAGIAAIIRLIFSGSVPDELKATTGNSFQITKQ